MEKNKEVLFGNEGRLAVKAGIDRAAKAVAPSLGAIGMGAMIEFHGLDPLEADDGITILKNLKFKDRHEQMGLMKLRKAALRTSAEGGDGTASTTVLTQALVEAAFKELGTDSSRSREVKERLEAGLAEAIELLNGLKRDVKDEDIERIALISSLDADVAKLIAEVLKEVGVHGKIEVEKGAELGYTKEVVPGARFDKGYLSEYFINDQERKRVVLENPFICLVDRKISLGTQVKSIMDAVAKTGNKSILFICDDAAGLGLASLIQASKAVTLVNEQTKEAITGTYDICVVKNPFTASPGRDFLADMAALTGAKIVSEEAGMRMDTMGEDVLGKAERVILTRDSCTIIGGKGDQEAKNVRVEAISNDIKQTTSEYEKDRLRERLAQLTGGIGVIRIGTYTDTDFAAKKLKFDNAIAATQAAVQEGVVAGGGIALLKVAVKTSEPMFKRALAAPFMQMASNAAMDQMGWDFGDDEGIDFKTKKIVNMFEAGIIDPFKVVRLALESAVNIAYTLTDKEVFITEAEEENEPKQ